MHTASPVPCRLQALLGHLAPWPSLWLVSGADESVPLQLQPGLPSMGRRLAAAAGPAARSEVVEGAPHNCEGHEQQLVASVMAFLGRLG